MSDALPIEIDVQAVQKMLEAGDDFVLLDVREQAEYDTAKIEGSRLLPMSEIQTRVSELADLQEKHLVVHCHHGGRSMQVVQWLAQQGFTQIQNMQGGIDAWSLQVDAQVPRY